MRAVVFSFFQLDVHDATYYYYFYGPPDGYYYKDYAEYYQQYYGYSPAPEEHADYYRYYGGPKSKTFMGIGKAKGQPSMKSSFGKMKGGKMKSSWKGGYSDCHEGEFNEIFSQRERDQG